MVTRDIGDERVYDKTTSSDAEKPLEDKPSKLSPDRPGYPKGIPELRKEDEPEPKPLPAAGKPSRPQLRDDSPKKPGADTNKPSKPKM